MTTTTLTLLHSNDMHGDFLAEQLDEQLVGGVAMLSGYINKVRGEEKNVLYAISGDMFRGSVIDSEFQGISTIEIMNMLSPDIATVGNHETDYGIAHLLFLERCARFPIINANLFITLNHARLFEPYKIIEIDGLKIMFIGILTAEVLAQTKSDGLIGSFVDIKEAAKEVSVICDNYKTTDVDLTVLLTHIGFEADCELARLLNPQWGVDLIIGGHSHTLLTAEHIENGIPIVQAGCGTDQIGRFELVFDRERRELIGYKWQLVPIDDSHCPKDEILHELIMKYKNHTDSKYGRLITRLARELTHPTRIAETELGNLFADLLAQDASYDIMLLGSGSVRLPKLPPLLEYQKLLECFPFDDPIYMVTVTGAQFRKMVLHILREEAYSGHTEFYQYSKGVRIVYSRSAKTLSEFSFNGVPIEDDAELKLGLQGYHYKNFDDFFGVSLEEISAKHHPRCVSSSCVSILEELLSLSNMLDSRVEGRLIIED